MKKTPKKEGRGHILKGHINLSTVYSYLKNGQYPPGLSDCDKRAVRKRAKSFCLTSGELYFIEPSKKGGTEDSSDQLVTLRKVLTSEEERRKTVLEAHIDPEGTHYGIEKTTNSVSSRYYWVGISNIVREIIRNCAVCQASRSNVSTSITPSLSRLFGIKQDPDETVDSDAANTSAVSSTPIPLFQPDMEPATSFWEKVELQILGPYSCGRRKLYVCVTLDIFSLWPEVTTLVDKSPSSITHFLINLICRYGVMKSIILRENTDVKFGDVLIRSDLLNQAGIELSLENFHVTETKDVWEEVENSVSTLVETHPDTWSQCLELCMLPHRVSRPQRAEYTPAYLVHGREFNLPAELSHQDTSSYIDVHMTADQRADSISALMGVYGGYGSLLRTVESHHKRPGMTRAPYVVCLEPGTPCPLVKVASVTVHDEEADRYKDKDFRSLPKNSVVKTVSVAPQRPLEVGQKRLVVVSLVERAQREKADDSDVDGDAVVKMELDGSDVDEGAVPTQDLDPDYITSTPVTRRRRTQDKCTPLLTSDRVTRRSVRRVTPSPAGKKTDTDCVTVATDAVDKVCSSGSQGLGFGMDDLDAYYTALEQYKLNVKYPEGSTNHQKRVLRKISQSYFIQDDVLYYLQGAKSKRKVVIKVAAQRLALLQRAHVSDIGAHVCRSKVIERLDSWNVYWKGLTLDCEAFVRACSSCEHGKERQRQDHLAPTKKEDTSVGEDDPEIEVDEPAEADDGTDENYDDLVEYLKHQKFPPKSNRNHRACLKRKSKYFMLIDDVLHFVWKDSIVKTPRRVLLTEEERTEAIRDVHSMYHFGRNRTYNMLRENYYWRRMPDDVTEYVKKCPQCEPRSYATEEELARRHVHMTDRVSWFREKIASQGIDVEKSGDGVVQSLLKMEQMETEEVEEIPEETSPSVRHKQQTKYGQDGNNTELKESPPAKTPAEDNVLGGEVDRSGSKQSVESPHDMVVEEEQRDSVINVKVYSELVESEGTDSPHVVVETLEGRDSDVSPPGESVSVVVEKQHTSSGDDIQSVSESSVDKVILVSETQDIIQPGLMTSPSTSAIISEQGIPVTSGHSIDSASGSVQLVVVPTEQWNAPDLNMLNERVRIPYSCERVSVEQIQDQEQSLILSNVNKAALSSGNALAELVKATVGDLGGEESPEKVSETASAVASIPSGDPQVSNTHQMDVDEDEEVGDDGEDLVPEDENAELAEEKEETDGETAIKSTQATESKKNNKFNCEVCGKVIKGSVTFKMHMYTHTGVKPFSCEICSKKFTNNKSLRIHMRKHTGDTPFLCNLCGKGFFRATSLRYHLKAHEEGGGVPVTCDVCGRDFTTSNRLEKHRLAKHPIQAPVFQCAECSKVFTAQRSLKRHMVSHQGIRQYQCQVCGRGFFRKEYLNSHLAQHPEVCQVSSTGQKIPRPRPKKKQIVNLDPSTGLQVQSVVQVSSNQPEVSQASDSTAFVFPQESVQYEVECLTSESTLTEADLKAIHFLAQASIHGQF